MIHLALVPKDRKLELGKLMDIYLNIHSEFQENKIGPYSHQDYTYFEPYWEEAGRYPYFIKADSEVVGFVLIRTVDMKPIILYEMAEFFIHPDFQRMGYGILACAATWQRHPGAWQLEVLYNNKKGFAFWQKCIQAHATSPIQETVLEFEDGRRYRFTFEVERV